MARNASYQIREWLVEPDLNRLSAGESAVTLEPQTMDVLVYLIDQAGEVVTTEALIAHVWAGRPMADNPLYKAVTKLRHALGDDARNPTFIETISKKGYRFIAPVEVLSPTEPGQPAEQNQAHEVASQNPRRRMRVFGVFVAVGILFVVAIATFQLDKQPVIDGDSLRPLVMLPGSNTQPSFDQTGERVVVVNVRGARSNLWLFNLALEELEQLTALEQSVAKPAWRPGADMILFNVESDLWMVNVVTRGTFLFIENANNAAWSPSGERFVFERGHEVWIARADGLGQRRISGISGRDQLFAPREPSFSPDGTKLVFFDADQGPTGHIKIYDFSTQEVRVVTQHGQIAGAPKFSHNGSEVLFHSSKSGRSALWRVALEDAGPARELFAGTSDDRLVTPIPGTSEVAYSSTRDQYELLATNLASGEERVLYKSRVAIVAPSYSTDESRIAFFGVTAGGGANLFVLDVRGQQPQQVTSGFGNHVMPKWSTDGEWLYHYHASAKGLSYDRVALAGGERQQMYAGANFNRQHDFTVDPTGTYAMFALMERNKLLETYLLELASGAEYPLDVQLTWPDWSTDGRRIVATEPGAGEFPVGAIVLCEVVTFSVTCQQLAERGQHPLWTADQQSIYYVNPVAQDVELWKADAATHQSEFIRKLGPVIQFGPFVDVSVDGHAIWVRYLTGESELWRVSLD